MLTSVTDTVNVDLTNLPLLMLITLTLCVHGEMSKVSLLTCCCSQNCAVFSFLSSPLSLSLPPEGLKKIRNPDRMYRSAVCYSGHAPPKGVSDDTEMNSKSWLLILHPWHCSKGPLAGWSIINSSIHLFTSWFHLSSSFSPGISSQSFFLPLFS